MPLGRSMAFPQDPQSADAPAGSRPARVSANGICVTGPSVLQSRDL